MRALLSLWGQGPSESPGGFGESSGSPGTHTPRAQAREPEVGAGGGLVGDEAEALGPVTKNFQAQSEEQDTQELWAAPGGTCPAFPRTELQGGVGMPGSWASGEDAGEDEEARRAAPETTRSDGSSRVRGAAGSRGAGRHGITAEGGQGKLVITADEGTGEAAGRQASEAPQGCPLKGH